jgi:hypothetical protein
VVQQERKVVQHELKVVQQERKVVLTTTHERQVAE